MRWGLYWTSLVEIVGEDSIATKFGPKDDVATGGEGRIELP